MSALNTPSIPLNNCKAEIAGRKQPRLRFRLHGTGSPLGFL
jgi:hypothetical protein